MKLLSKIQGMLERTYDVETAYDVHDFLTTDKALVNALSHTQAADVPERLLIVENDDCVDVALYLDESVLGVLERHDPIKSLHDGNLDAFWTVLEGVSHFLFFAWNAGFDREVRLLEMELQAEIDKFVSAILLAGRQRQNRTPAALHEWLFDKHRFYRHLDARELERYQRANRYAGMYCMTLQSRYLDGRLAPGLMTELRRFYRLSHHRKIRHIESCHAV